MRNRERVTVMGPATRAALTATSGGAKHAQRGGPAGAAQLRPDARDNAQLVVLMRVHRRLVVRTMGLLLAALFTFPLLLSALPDLTPVRLAGVPVLWLILGVGVYPILGISGWLHLRRAESVEDQLAESR